MSQPQRVQEQNQKIRVIINDNPDEATRIEKMAAIRKWFRPDAHSQYYPIIQSYLQGSIDIDSASRKLFTPIDAEITSGHLDEVKYTDLWYSILHSARQIPYKTDGQHENLAVLLSAFKAHNIAGNEEYNYLYSKMTDFSMACREAYNDTPEPVNAFDIEIHAWTNFNFFLAVITQKEIADLSLYAIWALRQGLEIPYEDNEELGTAAKQYDTYVPAAAAWVSGMHRVLYHKEQDLSPKEGEKMNPAKGGELWTGKAEFSKARWTFWKTRFAEVGERGDVSKETKEICADVVQRMERAETFQVVANE